MSFNIEKGEKINKKTSCITKLVVSLLCFCSLVLRQDVITSLFNYVQTKHTTSSNIPCVFITTEWINTL